MLNTKKYQYGAIAIEYVLSFALVVAIVYIAVSSMSEESVQLFEYVFELIAN